MTAGNCGIGRNAKAATFVLALCLVASVITQGAIRQPLNREFEASLKIRPHEAHPIRSMSRSGTVHLRGVGMVLGMTP